MYYLGFLVLTVQLTGAEPNNWEVNFFPTILRPQGRNPPRGSFRVSFELEKERLNFPSGLRYASGQCDLLASVDLIDAIRKSFLFFFPEGRKPLRRSLPSSWLTVWGSLAQKPAKLAWGMQWFRLSEAILPSPVQLFSGFLLDCMAQVSYVNPRAEMLFWTVFGHGSLSNYWTFFRDKYWDLPLGDLGDIALQILNAYFFRSKDIGFWWYCLQI